MTIWIGQVGITIHSGKASYTETLSRRFSGYVDDSEGQISLEIIETNFKPEITRSGDDYFWFTMFSGNIYVYINCLDWVGKAFICEETPVRYDAIDSMLTMIAAQFSPMFCSVLVHGCCVDYKGMGLCFIGDSGSGKSTLTKIFSADYQVIAEDMLSFECYEEKVVAYSIPIGQKHFWVEKGKNAILNSIFFVQNGDLRVEEVRNRKMIFDIILHNQFYKARTSDFTLMDAMRFNINRIYKGVKFYNFFWNAEQFYKKDRMYIQNVKKIVTETVNVVPDLNQQKSYNQESLSLSKHVRIRADDSKKRLELWDTSSHRLYGVIGLAETIIDYASKRKCFSIIELSEHLSEYTVIESNTLQNIVSELIAKKIIKGGNV